MSENKKILYLGFTPPPIGGVSVLSTQLYNYLKQNTDYEIYFIDMKTQYSKFKYFKELINKIRKVDLVTFQYGNNVSYFNKLDILNYLITRLFRKKLLFRCFGGSAHSAFSRYGYLKRSLIKRTLLKSDIILFETLENVNYFKHIEEFNRIEWYPNNKNCISQVHIRDKKANRFCFFGQIKLSKGILEIYEASNNLPEDICIDIYGPTGFDISEKRLSELNDKYKAKYRGCIEPENVTEKMKEYDALLLPTYYDGEGYPGVILEAYTMNMPIITTNWNSLTEIVNDNNGILITPRNADELKNAILKLYNDKNMYVSFQKYISEDRLKYDSKVWNEYFVKLLDELLN